MPDDVVENQQILSCARAEIEYDMQIVYHVKSDAMYKRVCVCILYIRIWHIFVYHEACSRELIYFINIANQRSRREIPRTLINFILHAVLDYIYAAARFSSNISRDSLYLI